MFGSDDEDAETFTEATPATDFYNNPPSSAQQIPSSQRHRGPVSNQNPPNQRSSNQVYGTRSVKSPWNTNEPIILPAADEDPFYYYPPDCIKLNGFVVTDEIPPNRSRHFSFMVFCQDDQKIYGIPRALTTPPHGLKKLSDVQKWRRKRELKFGTQIMFIHYRNYDVKEFAKGASDSLIAENIRGTNCFQVQCVLNSDLMEFYCVEFGLSQMPQPFSDHIENLAYDCQITFDEESAIQKMLNFTIFEVIKVSADQSIIWSTPWIQDFPTPVLNDNDIEEMKGVDNYNANKTGLRYAKNRVLHLRAENNVEIVVCADFNNLPEIGSIFQFDYIFHPLKKLAVVTAILQFSDQLEVKEIYNEQNEECEYAFKTSLDISVERNGFYYHETLGLVSDNNGCLRFAPYCTTKRPMDEIFVRVKACIRKPALFEIVEVCEESLDVIKACEPPFVQAVGVMINAKTGKIFSSKYPSLDLRIDKSICKKFKIGEFIFGTFYLNSPNDFGDNRYCSSDATKMKTESLKTLQITDGYALVVMKINRIKYTAPISKTQKKKNPLAEHVEDVLEYNFFLKNYFESTDGGLIGGSKGRVSAAADFTFAILETCPPGSQCIFNYVGQYDVVKYPLDLEKNIMLKNHVMKVINDGRECGHSTSTPNNLSSDSIQSTHSNVSPEFSQPPHQYDNHTESHPLNSASIPSSSTFRTSTVKPFYDNDNGSRADSISSSSRLPPSSTKARQTDLTAESYVNENVRNEPPSHSLYNAPPRPPPPGANPSNSDRSIKSSSLAPPISQPIPSSITSVRSHSGTATPISQNGTSSFKTQNFSSVKNTESPAHPKTTETLNTNVRVEREPFPQLGGPRYRNMCLYEKSENISPNLAVILDKMDLLLTNPAPPITVSVKKSRSEADMPEFEKFVERFLN